MYHARHPGSARLTVEHLMAAVKQLSPAELQEFTPQLVAWQQQNGQRAEEEAALFACIQENSRLPAAAQRRYERLCRKCERRVLTDHELTEYQALLQQLEARNVKRLEALIAPGETCSMPAAISRGRFMIGHVSPRNKQPKKPSRRCSSAWGR
jgi:hypothetical protein